MRIKWLLFLFFFVISSDILFAAGPVLHLWVAERFCKICNISNKDILEAIIVGAEFPDIRYITHDPRSFTHLPVSDIKEIYQSRTPFEAGMRLHVWLDEIREKFIPKEIYDEIASYAEGFSTILLKFIEDEILVDFYDGRVWLSYFDKILPEELLFAKKEAVSKWHEIIKWAVSFRLSNLLWLQSYRGDLFGIPANTLYNWSYMLVEFKQKLIFQQYLNSLLSFIEAELIKYSDSYLFFENNSNKIR
jgi:hypothetical protein